MANVKISNLPPVINIGATDTFPIVQAGVTSKGSASQMLSYVGANVQITQAQVTGLTTDSSPIFTGLNLSGLTASQAIVTDASKNLISLQYTSSATDSTIVSRDSNSNSIFNNAVSRSSNVTSANGTTNLTVGSRRIQKLTGTLNQTFRLPNATTLFNGWPFQFDDNSTGTLSVTDFGGNLLTIIPSGNYVNFTCTDASTSNGVWDYHSLLPINGVTSGPGISVNYTGGAIQITSTYTPWTVLGNNQNLTMVPFNGYVSNTSSGSHALLLPTTSSVGDYIDIWNTNSTTTSINLTQSAGQQITQTSSGTLVGTPSYQTTSGASGYIDVDSFTYVRIMCHTANTGWGTVFVSGLNLGWF